jgi:hypothetical protein
MKRNYPQFIHTAFVVFILSPVFAFVSMAQASDITPEKVVELVNQDRISQNLPSLQMNDLLTRAAQAKVDDMRQEGYFAHTSPMGVTPWHWVQESGYEYHFAGENLAIRFTDAEEQERAWMASVKHKENILNPKYRDIGVAVEKTIQNGKESIIVVQMFGLPMGVTVPVLPTIADASVQGTSNETPVPSKQTASYMDQAGLWMQWFGFLIVGMMISTSLLMIFVERKIVYYKWFHKNHIFQYRG